MSPDASSPAAPRWPRLARAAAPRCARSARRPRSSGRRHRRQCRRDDAAARRADGAERASVSVYDRARGRDADARRRQRSRARRARASRRSRRRRRSHGTDRATVTRAEHLRGGRSDAGQPRSSLAGGRCASMRIVAASMRQSALAVAMPRRGLRSVGTRKLGRRSAACPPTAQAVARLAAAGIAVDRCRPSGPARSRGHRWSTS